VDLDRYCSRIGYGGPREATLEVLRALHARHTEAIAFENLNPLLGLPVPLDPESLVRKMVEGRRGGWCFEQNWLFRRALEAVGFPVRGLAARVLWGAPEGRLGPRSHMVLEIDLGGRPYLADVGFGGVSLTGPIRLEPDLEQATPHETFRLRHLDEDEFVLEVQLGQWAPMYRFRREQHLLPDYEVSSFYLCHHPDSFFRRDLVAARTFPGGRFTLRNSRLTIYRLGSPPETTVLTSAVQIRTSLERDFLLDPPDTPELGPALARIAQM
jgi:N-hydroxyarylamine O-acetyltransferase